MSDESTKPGFPDFSTANSGTPPKSSCNVPQIEGYEIIGSQPLGGGGMGTVWRAIQLGTRQPVALKLINAAYIGSKEARERFLREVRLAASVQHPNIARVYDGGEHHGACFCAMQLVDGAKPLDIEYINDHRLSQRQILELMAKICRAVQVAHQHGVIHTDLKPPNILVSKDGEPYVLDFGLAKSLQTDEAQPTLSKPGLVAGTLPYMSPEQAAGRRLELDTTTDVYSLGVILFELLTGKSPRERTDDPIEMRRRILQDPVRRPSKLCKQVDAELEALLLKTLADEPARRYQLAGGLADDIDNYLTGRLVTAQKPTRIYFLRKQFRKHQTAILLIVIGVCTGMSLLALIRGDNTSHAAPMTGAPHSLKGSNSIQVVWSTPLGFREAYAGDIDGDGKPELVAGDGSNIAIFTGQGKPLTNFNNLGALALVADITGDGKAEIFASRRSPDGFAQTTAYSADGKIVQTFFIKGAPDTSLVPFRVEDFDGDGHLEVAAIIGSAWSKGPRGVVVFDAASGREFGRTEVGPAIHSTPWVGPVAGDVRSRIIFGGSGIANGRTAADGSDDSSCYVWCLDSKGNAIWRRGPFDTGGFSDSDVVVPEVRPDKRRDIIVSVRRHGWNDWEARVGRLFMLNADRGTARDGFVREFHSPVRAVAAPDLTPNGEKFVLAVHEDPAARKFYIRALKMEPGFPDWKAYDAGSTVPEFRAAGNLLGDGGQEFVFTAGNKLLVLSNDLRLLGSWMREGGNPAPLIGARLADFSGNRAMQIVAMSGDSRATYRVDVLSIPSPIDQLGKSAVR